MKKIIPVELYIRDLYRVYVECDENTTNDEAAALARQMALCGDVDHTMLATDQEIEYDDVQIAFVDDDAAWTEEEEQEMKARATAMMKASEFFNIPVDELRVDRGDNYQRGDCIILDKTLISTPFYSDLLRAAEDADYYRKTGWYTTVLLIETDYSSDYNYAVIAF